MVRKLLILSLFVVVLSLNMISAEIMLSQPSSIYNLGEILKVKATIKPTQDVSGFFELFLECETEKVNFHRQFLDNLKAGQEKIIDASVLLVKSFLFDVNENCSINAKLLGGETKSQSFKISDKIDVKLSVDETSVEAGKNLVVKGTAIKENSKNAEGFVELYAENTDVKVSGSVSNSSFSSQFSFPKNTKSGNYILKARVYEKYKEELTNEGEGFVILTVKQTPKKIEIFISNESIKPGNSFGLRVAVYDQADENIITGNIEVGLYNSEEKIIFQKILASDKEENIGLEKNSTPGYWKITASSLNLENKKLFYVQELEEASFDVTNDILTVTNIGNIVYKKPIQIEIGGYTEIKNLNLEVGESIKLILSAPEGNYDVTISDGEKKVEWRSIPLTGSIIGVSEMKQGFRLLTKYPLVWLFLILVLGMFIMVIARKISKKSVYSYPVEEIKREPKTVKISELKSIIETGNLKEAEHTLVVHGNKEDASLVALKIKKMGNDKECKGTLSRIEEAIAENKGAVYKTFDFVVGLFSSLTTKSFKNEMLAIRTATNIEILLKEHNRKFKQKIDYGIALNSGELILSKDAGKIKFTSLGNTLALAKKIAEVAENELLLSENISRKVAGEVKSEKDNRNGLDVYKIVRINERGKYDNFISGFLQRNK